MRTRRLLILGAALWCCLIVAAPVLAASGGVYRAAAGAVYGFFSPVCHQWDSHSFHLCGEKFGVCIRCSAIYAGFLAGIVLYPRLGKACERRFGARTLLAAGAAGMLADAACSVARIAESSTASRLATWGIFGVLAAFVLTPLLQELMATLAAAAAQRRNNRLTISHD